MAQRGRGNKVPDEDRLRVLRLNAEKDMDGQFAWNLREISKEVNVDPKIVRRILRETCEEVYQRFVK